ncbi:hypothetical protein [Candidatus Mycoplasma haematominutum]|uniref:Uncharacterized protein n=1 Tax=Candidatus Mycoplasma haematominutum 'Birmingham 1' TaxID=1116213 RepID=G8C3J0_9MOLU|nr:hypothetical protein [Candidatus Mycoplasma haematominutum]CCE66888.1 hypothetical protein MHM_03700 [Candidatus Mycoplasma haematominutum 'Birmingham 1']
MFSKKTRLVAAALLLGTLSGASLSNLDLGSVRIPSGGGAPTSLSHISYERGESQLGLEEPVKELKVSKQREIVASKLQEIKQDIDLAQGGVIDDKQSGMTVKDTFSEIVKEDKTLKLDKTSEAKFAAARGKAQKHLDNFRSGKTKLDAYVLQSSAQSPRRRKRSAPSQNAHSPLTHEERKAFFEMYKIVEELEKEQENLLPQLASITGTPATAIPLKSKPKSSELQSKLTQINWNNSGEVRYSTERKGGYGKPDTPNSWLDWNSNPFKSFFSEAQEYTELIDKLKKFEKDRDSYISGRRLWGLIATGIGPGTVHSTYSGLGKYEGNLSAVKEEFSNKVALKFLEWMGQKLSISTP